MNLRKRGHSLQMGLYTYTQTKLEEQKDQKEAKHWGLRVKSKYHEEAGGTLTRGLTRRAGGHESTALRVGCRQVSNLWDDPKSAVGTWCSWSILVNRGGQDCDQGPINCCW